MMILAIYHHPHTPVDLALRPVAGVDRSHSLVGVHDVIQCTDWLIQVTITSFRSHGLTYVISHAYGYTLHGYGT